ncbi:MAG: cell division topological specificity factor MinE [Moraxella sp.]|nr:cell division topological specificity factor MinE [Moraxella sp.]
MKKKSWFSRLLGQDSGPSSAEIAKNRLTVLVASNDNQLKTRLTQERIDKMKREIAEVVSKYVSGVQIDDIDINHTKEESMDVLQMSISLPENK